MSESTSDLRTQCPWCLMYHDHPLGAAMHEQACRLRILRQMRDRLHPPPATKSWLEQQIRIAEYVGD